MSFKNAKRALETNRSEERRNSLREGRSQIIEIRFRRSDQAMIRSLKLKKADRRDYFTAHKVKSQFFSRDQA